MILPRQFSLVYVLIHLSLFDESLINSPIRYAGKFVQPLMLKLAVEKYNILVNFF